MKRCYTLSKSGNRININTFKRVLYPRYPVSVHPSRDLSRKVSLTISPSVSKASRLPWYVRFILWFKRNILKISC